MPLPTPKEGESEQEFVSRCIEAIHGDPAYQAEGQAAAVCYGQWRKRNREKMLDDLEAAAENYLEKGWLPSGMSQNDLSDGDFAWISSAYRQGKQSKSSGRKLPYKIHGKVNVRGWKAAMAAASGARGGTKFTGGPSKEQVIRRLCRDKPKEVESEVCANLGKQEKTSLDLVEEIAEGLVDRIQDDMDRQTAPARTADVAELTLMQKIKERLGRL